MLPDWVQALKPLADYADWLASFAQNPAPTIRGVVSGMLISGIAYFVEPWIDMILLLSAGSKPSEFAAENEVWGIADFPVAAARIGGDAVALPIELLIDVLADVIRQSTPASEGPAEGLAVTIVLSAVVYATIRYGPIIIVRVVRVLVSTIPTVGVPIAELIDNE